MVFIWLAACEGACLRVIWLDTPGWLAFLPGKFHGVRAGI
jgi:hypothetical protein